MVYSAIRVASLVILSVQNVLHTIAMRESRAHSRDHFLTSSALVLSESVKLIVSAVILLRNGQLGRTVHLIKHNPRDFFQTCVPALIYVFQNSLLFYALSHLDATLFQVTYQIKLLTTAMFSVIFLNKRISHMQWMSLLFLFTGVVIAQFSENTANAIKHDSSKSFSSVSGLLAVLCASLLSGFAAVYFERLLKFSTKSLWVRNFELALASVAITVTLQIFTEFGDLKRKGFFYGFDWLVWSIVALQSGGGLVVALVVKYADNILKGFACSASIVISCFISVIFLGLKLSATFLFGSTCVVAAVVMYSLFPETSVRALKVS